MPCIRPCYDPYQLSCFTFLATSESARVWDPLTSTSSSSSSSIRVHRSSTSDLANATPDFNPTYAAANYANYATPTCATSDSATSGLTTPRATRRLSFAAPNAPRGWLPFILSAPCFADQKRRLYTQVRTMDQPLKNW